MAAMVQKMSVQFAQHLKNYFYQLTDQAGRKRYIDKLASIGGIDPYEIQVTNWCDDITLWPNVTHIDIAFFYWSLKVLTLRKN